MPAVKKLHPQKCSCRIPKKTFYIDDAQPYASPMLTILSFPGWGSAIVEACAELTGLSYQTEDVDPSVEGPAKDRLQKLNPLLQLPTVVLEDGSVLTESAAIAFYMADLAPGANIVPAPGDAARPAFLRWLVFFVAAVYPTFTYGDAPQRFVTSADARKELRASTDALRNKHFQLLESVVKGPFFLGDRLSVLDVYVWVMVHWRPGRAWFEQHTPKLAAIARSLDADPRLAKVKARNFP